MPEDLERKLKREAKKKFGSVTSERAGKYIYGTLRKLDWTPSRQRKRGGNDEGGGYIII